jgi:hypothetical protein
MEATWQLWRARSGAESGELGHDMVHGRTESGQISPDQMNNWIDHSEKLATSPRKAGPLRRDGREGTKACSHMQALLVAMIQGHGRAVKCRAGTEGKMRHRRWGES